VTATAGPGEASPGDCPWCGVALPARSRFCLHCGEDLSGVENAARARAALEATLADIAAGRPPPPPERWRRILPDTLGSIALTVLAVVAAALGTIALAVLMGSMNGRGSLHPRVLVLAVPWALGLGWALWTGRRPDLRTPESATRALLRCLERGRYANAWHLLVPRTRSGTRRRPWIVNVPGSDRPDMASPAGLSLWWEALQPAPFRAYVVTRFHEIEIQRDSEHPDTAWAVVAARVTTPYDNQATGRLLLARPFQPMQLEIPLVRVGDSWRPVDATLLGPPPKEPGDGTATALEPRP
jgi:hypothetical protein